MEYRYPKKDEVVTLLHGAGAPSALLGADGSYYIDDSAHRLYGPKTGSSWGSGVIMEGSDGADGAPGAQGAQGDPGMPLGDVNWRGEWSGATTYAAGDGCTLSDNAYVSLQAGNLNHQPPNATYWAKVGAEGSTTTEVVEEEPTGSGTSLTLAHTPLAGTLKLLKNGVRMRSGVGNGFTLSGNVITLTTAKVAGDWFSADYKY